MIRMKPCLLAAALCALPVAASAELPNVQPGEWEYTNTTRVQGPVPIPPRTEVTRECVTPEEVAQGDAFLSDLPDECSVSDLVISSDRMSYTMHCVESDFEMNMSLDMEFHGDRIRGEMSGTMDNPMGEMSMTIEIQGERVGEC